MGKLLNKLCQLSFALILTAVFLAGCSTPEREEVQKQDTQIKPILPPLAQIRPDDSYLFLPLESGLGFQLIFARSVDPAAIEKAVSFEPDLDFDVKIPGKELKEVFLEPLEKLASDTIYTLTIAGVENKSGQGSETLNFTFKTEFQSEKEISQPVWSHDGKEIIFPVRRQGETTAELWKASVENGGEELLVKGLAWPAKPSWSKDDSAILYTKMLPNPDKSNFLIPEVRSIGREGGREKTLVPAERFIALKSYPPINVFPWWSPDGSQIVLQLELGGEDSHSDLHRFMAVADSSGANLHPVEGQIFVGWGKDNSLMALKTHQNYNHSRAYRYDLLSVDVNGQKTADLVLGEGQIPNFDMAGQSPDLNTLAIGEWKSLNAVGRFKQEGVGIRLYDVRENSLTRLDLGAGYQKHPAVNPAEGSIAFTSNQDGNWGLYLWENGVITKLTRTLAHELYPSWSPDGKKLAFVSTQSGREEIWLLELSFGQTTQLTGGKLSNI